MRHKNNLANKFSAANRKIKISLKGPKDIYIFNKYTIDSNCSRDCGFKPIDDKDIDFNQGYVETIELTPYSVQLLVFKKKPAPPVEVKPEVKPEVETEIKPEIKPEVKPEVKPEIKKEEQPKEKTPAEGKKDAESK